MCSPMSATMASFNGSRFQAEIAPRIADFVLSRNGGRNLRSPVLKVVGQR